MCIGMNEIESGSATLMTSFFLVISMVLIVGGFSTSSLVAPEHTPHTRVKLRTSYMLSYCITEPILSLFLSLSLSHLGTRSYKVHWTNLELILSPRLNKNL